MGWRCSSEAANQGGPVERQERDGLVVPLRTLERQHVPLGFVGRRSTRTRHIRQAAERVVDYDPINRTIA
jgi:hypothetical protein